MSKMCLCVMLNKSDLPSKVPNDKHLALNKCKNTLKKWILKKQIHTQKADLKSSLIEHERTFPFKAKTLNKIYKNSWVQEKQKNISNNNQSNSNNYLICYFLFSTFLLSIFAKSSLCFRPSSSLLFFSLLYSPYLLYLSNLSCSFFNYFNILSWLIFLYYSYFLILSYNYFAFFISIFYNLTLLYSYIYLYINSNIAA